MKKTFLIATALANLVTGSHAQDPAPTLLSLLPREAQQDIEGTRSRCREFMSDGGAGDNLSFPDDAGLTLFTLSGGLQAVMVNHYELCDGKYFKGANYNNRGGHLVSIFVRYGKTWKKALEEDIHEVFLSLSGGANDSAKFRALVLSILQAKGTPDRDVVVRWNGTKFVYKPL